MLYCSDDDPGQDFDALDGDVEQAFAVWRAECHCWRAGHRVGGSPCRVGDIALQLARQHPQSADTEGNNG